MALTLADIEVDVLCAAVITLKRERDALWAALTHPDNACSTPAAQLAKDAAIRLVEDNRDDDTGS